MGRGERRAPCRCVCRRREKRPRVLGTRGTPSAQARRSFPRTFRRGTDRSPRGAVASHAASPQSSLSPSSRRGLMNSHRGSYVAEAARSTGHGDGGARREGARRRATRERTVADRNGRDFLRRGVDATSWGGGARGRTRHLEPEQVEESARGHLDDAPARGTGARRERARRDVRGDGEARGRVDRRHGARGLARGGPEREREREREPSGVVARGARAAPLDARARRGRHGRRGGSEGRREGGAEAPRSMTWRAGASSGIVGRRGRRRARVCSPRARARDERARRASLRARASAPERATGARTRRSRASRASGNRREDRHRARVDGALIVNPHFQTLALPTSSQTGNV